MNDDFNSFTVLALKLYFFFFTKQDVLMSRIKHQYKETNNDNDYFKLAVSKCL